MLETVSSTARSMPSAHRAPGAGRSGRSASSTTAPAGARGTLELLASAGEIAARSPLAALLAALSPGPRRARLARFIVLLILVAIFAPLLVKLLGIPGPERAEPQPHRRLRVPARPDVGAPVRRRPARPRRAGADHLRRAGLARGRHRRHGDRRPLIGVAVGLLAGYLPRLGRHAALAHDRRRAVVPGAAARPRHRRRVRGAGLRRAG